MRGLILGLALIGLVGCGKPAGDGKQVANQPAQSKILTRAEFDEAVKTLKTGNDFIAKFGKPARTSPNSGSDPTLCLIFEKVTTDPISGKTDRSVLVYVKGNSADGEYVRHTFMPGI